MGRQLTIDLVTRAPDGTCILVIAEDRPLTTEDLPALQSRIYDYRDSALGGQVAARFPEVARSAFVIRVDLHAAPDPAVMRFLRDMEAILAMDRMGLEVNVLGQRAEL